MRSASACAVASPCWLIFDGGIGRLPSSAAPAGLPPPHRAAIAAPDAPAGNEAGWNTAGSGGPARDAAQSPVIGVLIDSPGAEPEVVPMKLARGAAQWPVIGVLIDSPGAEPEVAPMKP